MADSKPCIPGSQLVPVCCKIAVISLEGFTPACAKGSDITLQRFNKDTQLSREMLIVGGELYNSKILDMLS